MFDTYIFSDLPVTITDPYEEDNIMVKCKIK